MSASERFRQQGNAHYTSVKPGLAPSLGTERYKQALQCYQRAFDSANDDAEKSLAAKNIGMASWRLVSSLNEGTVPSGDRNLEMYYCKEALKYFSLAFLHGQTVNSAEWIDGVVSFARACWEHVLHNLLEQLDITPRCRATYDVVTVIGIDVIKGHSFLKLAEYQFHRGIMALQSNDHKTCMDAMRECYTPLQEARRLCTEDDKIKEVKVLEEDVHMHTCMAESIQARVIGDELFEKVLRDEETLNIDMVWEVIDWYTQAFLRTKEVTEVELEAVAMSRIGRIYGKVLKLKHRAKEYFKKAVELALSMSPRIFTTEDWYVDATETLAQYQRETISYEEELRSKARAEIITELEADIKILNRVENYSYKEFLQYIYEHLPPRKEGCKLVIPEDDQHLCMIKNIKKLLQKAVIHYHPDGVDAEQHGMRWKVLSEEICKRCTAKYENVKGK